MKNYLFLFTLLLSCSIALLLPSCSKDPGFQHLRFSPSLPGGTESINFDDIDHTTVIFSDIFDPADSQVVNLDVRKESLNLKIGHTYSFKKFEMVGKSGRVLYFIPSRTDTTAKNIGLRVPFYFRIPEDESGIVVWVAPNPY